MTRDPAGAAHILFGVPMHGQRLAAASALATLFIAANLAVGYTFSTIAENQLQAMQMTFFFFLPNILLSGFMFPFRGMPDWAQAIGEMLPLTHFLRIVRGITLKGNGFADMQIDVLALFCSCWRRWGLLCSASAAPSTRVRGRFVIPATSGNRVTLHRRHWITGCGLKRQ